MEKLKRIICSQSRFLISIQNIIMAATAPTSMYNNVCLNAIEALSDKITIHTYDDYNGKANVRVSEGVTDKDLKYHANFSTPPLVVRWEHLSGLGDLGSKFAPEKPQAKYSVTLTAGSLGSVVPDSTEQTALEGLQDQWFDAVEVLEKQVLTHMFNDKVFCPKKKKTMKESSRKTLAKARGVKPKDIPDTDPDFQDMCLDNWIDGANRVVSNDNDTGAKQFKVKTKVFVRDYDSKDPNAEKITQIPLLDAKTNTVLNADGNDDKYINRGDLVGVDFQMKPYILPSGIYGNSIVLKKVFRIQSGDGGGGGKKRRRCDYSTCFEKKPRVE